MEGICKLTGKKANLKQSHIYPKFAVDWLKETGLKYLRRSSKPNIRNQDGKKLYLLSEEGEQLFSKSEKWFAERVFRPYLNDSSVKIDYDENLFYFSISFLWRILMVHFIEEPGIKDFVNYEILVKAELEWRAFLYKGIYPKNFDRIHIFLTDRLKDHDLPYDNVDNYFTRALHSTYVYNLKRNFLCVYGKFSRFMFFGLLGDCDESLLINSKIFNSKGSIKMPQEMREPTIGNFLVNAIKKIESMPGPSSKQEKIIIDEIKRNYESFIKSDNYKSIFVDKAFLLKNKKQ